MSLFRRSSDTEPQSRRWTPLFTAWLAVLACLWGVALGQESTPTAPTPSEATAPASLSTPETAAAPETAAPAEPAPDNATLSTALNTLRSETNLLWVCLSAFLVFWMQAGFALVECGFTRTKNAANITMKNMI
ncbi:MAG TPA: hypothetical protein VGE52_20055, partial [Pirellulales bacterium]